MMCRFKAALVLITTIMISGCASEKPVELYRSVRPDSTRHIFVVPSSVRDNGEERVVQMQLRFSDVQAASDIARLDLKAIQTAVAFDCDKRIYREIAVVGTSNSGKTRKEGPSQGTRDVPPESAVESVMEFACASSVTRAWMAHWSEPKIH